MGVWGRELGPLVPPPEPCQTAFFSRKMRDLISFLTRSDPLAPFNQFLEGSAEDDPALPTAQRFSSRNDWWHCEPP